jgi:glycosyltransferase A (GT-A) superfamily protein (DUF2064 family)
VAAEWLLAPGDRAVLGPSADGGYYLIGLQKPIAHLFEDITWSTAIVATQTLERAAEAGLPVELLQPWYDVDDEASLCCLYEELFDRQSAAPRGYAAPHTREYLAGIPQPGHATAVEAESAV